MNKFILLICCFASCLLNIHLQAQTSYYYPLNNSYNEATGSAPALVPIPNDIGQTGTFATRAVSACPCTDGGVFSGYDYPFNAGFRFDIPAGFITCEYSIQFTWQFDNPAGIYEWIRMLSFIYTDDSGLTLRTELPNLNSTMYYWHIDSIYIPFLGWTPFPEFGTLSPQFHFATDCFYQMTVSRSCADDSLKIYANGVLLGGFVDSDQKYMPDPASNHIVFFRDTVTNLAPTPFPNEASPGFIKNLLISNQEFTQAQITMAYDTFCPIVLPMRYAYVEAEATTAGNQIRWAMEDLEMVDQFDIERSADGLNFDIIESIALGAEIRQRQEEFVLVDQQPVADKLYYRIRARNLNGQTLMSRVEEVIAPIPFQVYPNPASNLVWINLPETSLSQDLDIRNVQGQILRKQTLVYGRNRLSLEGLPDGMLMLRVGTEEVIRLIKQ